MRKKWENIDLDIFYFCLTMKNDKIKNFELLINSCTANPHKLWWLGGKSQMALTI